MRTGYRIREFAAMAGVTVKTLHHYDLLGLLSPRRTDSGYRVYTGADLERLEQIVALKLIGVPLRAIRILLDRGAPAIADALRLQRRALEEKRRQIDRAIAAIGAAEQALAEHPATASAVLSRLIEALAMDQNIDILKEYFGETAWTEWKSRRASQAPRDWQALYRDIDAAGELDVRSPQARALADRWLALLETEAGGDAAIKTGLIKAWAAGHRLPQLVGRRPADDAVSRATRFVAEVLWTRWDDEATARPPEAVRHKVSDSRLALFRRAEAMLGTDPASPQAEALLADWDALLEQEAGGDTETIRMMRLSLARHASWPDGMRKYVASLYATTPEGWDRVAEFLTRARTAHEARRPG